MPALALLTAPAADSLEELRSRVKATAQRRPGVYQFVDEGGGVFYVGKAKDLRARLLSYFSAPWPDSKSAHLIRAAADITWRYQPSEFAALLEELRLIARLRPFSNVRGNRTRRRMVFVKLTGGTAQKLKVTEHTADRAARYFGPFQSGWRTADSIRVLSDLLKLRDCAQDRPLRYADQADLFGASEPAACMRHELGTCLGPCAAKQPALSAQPLAQAVRHSVCAHRGPHLAFRPATNFTIARTASRPTVRAGQHAAGALPCPGLVSIPKTDAHTSRQQHNGGEP